MRERLQLRLFANHAISVPAPPPLSIIKEKTLFKRQPEALLLLMPIWGFRFLSGFQIALKASLRGVHGLKGDV